MALRCANCAVPQGSIRLRACFPLLHLPPKSCSTSSRFFLSSTLQADQEFVELLAGIRAGTCPQDKLSALLQARPPAAPTPAACVARGAGTVQSMQLCRLGLCPVLSSVRPATSRCPSANLPQLCCLQTCQRALPVEDGILPTKLYTHREDVDAINHQQLKALEGEGRKFVAQVG